MKIKRFVAADMRQAMRLVREEQGPDAVILSTRRLDDGIEIIAALDYDEALVREAMGTPAAPARPAAPAEPVATRPHAAVDDYRAAARAAAEAEAETRRRAAAIAAGEPPRAASRPLGDADAPVLSGVCQELGQLREMLESQLASLAWNDLGRRQPLRARVLRDLTRIGLDADIAAELVAELPTTMNSEQARYLPLGILTRRLAVSGRDLTDIEGTLALVGPTGVGKTTTVAKLAARSVLRHGGDGVALISTDHYRIGAGAQLEHYGRLLGVPVVNAHDGPSLRRALRELGGRRTVLIDTAGMGAHDPRLVQQLSILHEVAGDVSTALVAAANAHPMAIDEAVRAFLPLRPRGGILTKLDEAPSLGGALSVLIRHHLVLDYTTDGQRVPEDIASADARKLVCRAARPKTSHQNDADDVLMAERFGRQAQTFA